MSTVLKKRTRQSPFRELSKDYWEGVRRGSKLPKTIRAASIPDEHAIFKRFLPQEGHGRTSLIEVGCAPGRYLDYFAKNFGYRVAGLDYAPEACELTRRNLAMLGVDAQIENTDLFQYRPDGDGFEIEIKF